MDLQKVPLPGLTESAVDVVGDWVPRPYGGYRDWQGRVTCSLPIVAMGLIASGEHVEWVKGARPARPSLEIHVFLGPYDARWRDLHVALGVGRVGQGPRSQTTMPRSDCKPAVRTGQLVTGKFTLMCTVQGQPLLDLWALFLVQSDVRGLRNKLWRVSPSIAQKFGEPWHRVLTYGRTGQLALP